MVRRSRYRLRDGARRAAAPWREGSRFRGLQLESLEERALLNGVPVATEQPFETELVQWLGQQQLAAKGRWIVDVAGLGGTQAEQDAGVANLLAASGLSSQVSVVHSLGADGLYLLDVSSEMAFQDAYAALQQLGGNLEIVPDFMKTFQATPDDPRFGEMYGLNNTGQTVQGNVGTVDADIDAVEAWDGGTGSSNVIVAVLDTGIDYTHPDLVNNIWTNPGEIPGNGIDDDANGFIDDVHGYDFFNFDGDPMDDVGHGTHVAGTIGAEGNNGLGVVGVNWDVSMMALKIGGLFGIPTSAAIAAINYVSMMSDRGVDIRLSNNSWAGGPFEQPLFDAIAGNQARGILFVAAAGNESNNNDIFPTYPASYNLDNIISVAATDNHDTLASFSNFGVQTVDLAAPGVDVLSTLPGGGYGYNSGTSMASPHVAGAAALAFSRAPNATYADVRQAILDGVDAKGNLTGVVATGGRLNLVGMMTALTRLSVNDVTQLEGTGGTSGFVFTVTLGGPVSQPVTVQYATVAGTATAGADYTAQTGTLTFTLGGPTTRAITIQVAADAEAEPDETFFVELSNATNAGLTRSLGTGTILNDDVEVSINDVTVAEGDSGTTSAVFTITAFGATDHSSSVSYATANGTALADSDYLSRSGAVTFAPSGGAIKITVPILGDRFNEATETFTVQLLSPQGSQITKGTGVGTILDNDILPAFYVGDVQIKSVEAGLVMAEFSVALDAPSGREVTVKYAAQNGTALSGTDYDLAPGVLTFAPGATTRLVSVPVQTGGAPAPNKTFYLKLSDPFNAELGDPQGACTIIFDDGPLGERTIDDGDPGYSKTAGWVNLTNTLAYQLDYDYHAPGGGGNSATWTFDSLADGQYQVFTRWIPFTNRATNAPFTVFDGGTPLGTLAVNQQLAPVGDVSNGIIWQSLGTFQITSGALIVRLSDNANGLVVADAVRIVADGIAPQAPEIDVAGFGRSIGTFDGSPAFEDGTDFGTVAATSNSATRTFTIRNDGNSDLHLTGSPRVAVGGIAASDFTVLVQPAAVVAPGGTTSFQVIFHPSQANLRTAELLIASDDANEHPYRFAIQGMGSSPGPSQFTVDDSSGAFQTLGAWSTNANTSSFGGQHRAAAAGAGSQGTWTFSSLAPGQYNVLTTWVPFGNRSAAAPFTIADGTASANTINVNQQQAPNDVFSDGVSWETLTSLFVTTGTLTVRLASAAGGFVIADAVRIVRQGAAANVQAAPTVAHNAAMPWDVNADGRVSTFDALLVIGEILAPSAATSGGPAAVAQSVSGISASATAAASAPLSRFFDVTGDGRLSPLDALTVINYLLKPVAKAAAVPAAVPAASPSAIALAVVDQAISEVADDELAAEATTVLAASSPSSGGDPPASAAPLMTDANVRAFFASSAKKPASKVEASSAP